MCGVLGDELLGGFDGVENLQHFVLQERNDGVGVGVKFEVWILTSD